MSEDRINSFEQGKSSEFEFTSNSLESYADGVRDSKSMECHFSYSDVEKQIDAMPTGQEENEMILSGNFETLIDTSDEEKEMVNMQYSLGSSDEDEHVDHMGTGQNRNVMVLDDQSESISSCSKSGEYNISDEIDNILTEQEGNEIYVLDELDEKCDDNLPPGWKKINHASGMPMYFNDEMKICTFSKPYYLGTKSLKHHNIPIENIPCLDYKLKLEVKNSQKDDDKSKDLKTELTPEEYKEYCDNLFKFKEIKCMKFRSWEKRREYLRMAKADQRSKGLLKYETIPSVVAIPVDPPTVENAAEPDTGEWIIKLNNKSYISILHEYVQCVLKTEMSYTFKELENARYPYMATVILDGIQYGIGIGSSKRQAKLDSARASLEILLPSAKDQIKINRKQEISKTQANNVFKGYLVFDELKIKDPRIPEFCFQAAESMPYDMLQICVKRNFGEDVHVESDMQKMQSSNDSDMFYTLTMTVKHHMATVICKNKREGRQKGAQALLKVLHPHLTYFGSLIRLYSHQNVGGNSEKKPDDSGTQSPPPSRVANQDILNKLRATMTELGD